jgi:Arc/MetJ-type ribon-helix-helix transcriptional regulator
MADKLTSIQVTDSLRRKLKILVAKHDYKNYDELIRAIIKDLNGDLDKKVYKD